MFINKDQPKSKFRSILQTHLKIHFQNIEELSFQSRDQFFSVSELPAYRLNKLISWNKIMHYTGEQVSNFLRNKEVFQRFLIVLQKKITLHEPIQNQACKILFTIYQIINEFNKGQALFNLFYSIQVGFRSFYQLNDEYLIETFKKTNKIHTGLFFENILKLLKIQENLQISHKIYEDIEQMMLEEMNRIKMQVNPKEKISIFNKVFKIILKSPQKNKLIYSLHQTISKSAFMESLLYICHQTMNFSNMKAWLEFMFKKYSTSQTIIILIKNLIDNQPYALSQMELHKILKQNQYMMQNVADQYFLGLQKSDLGHPKTKQIAKDIGAKFFDTRQTLKIFHLLAFSFNWSWQGRKYLFLLDQGNYFYSLSNRFKNDHELMHEASLILKAKCPLQILESLSDVLEWINVQQ